MNYFGKNVILCAFGALMALTACSGGGKGAAGGGSSSSTWTLSGTLDMSALLASVINESDSSVVESAKRQVVGYTIDLLSEAEPQSVTQCADGMYYRVACLAWSIPVVTVEAAVDCTNPSSGQFAVAGLPINTDVTCLVRQSTTGASNSFNSFGVIELPAAGISGATDTIATASDMVIEVPVTSSGVGVATVQSGSNAVDDRTGSVEINVTSLSGYYGAICSSALSASSRLSCRCFMGYDSGSYSGPDDCIADNGANLPANPELNLYINFSEGTATGDVDIGPGAGPELTTGQKIYVSSFWGASCSSTTAASCASSRPGSGAEGLPSITNLTWSNANVTNTIPWAYPAGEPGACAHIPTNVQGATAVPSNSATRSTWLTWYRNLMAQYASNAGGHATAKTLLSCSGVGNIQDEMYCLHRFSRVLRDCSEYTVGAVVPAVRISDFYATDGSKLAVTDQRIISIQGLSFAADGSSDGGPGAAPWSRYVMDIFTPNTNGTGGSISAWSDDNRTIQCITGTPSGTWQSDACPGTGTDGGINCYSGRDLKIRLVPNGSGTSMIFKEDVNLFYLEIMGRGIVTPTTEQYAAAAELCKAFIYEDNSVDFTLDLTKKTP